MEEKTEIDEMKDKNNNLLGELKELKEILSMQIKLQQQQVSPPILTPKEVPQEIKGSDKPKYRLLSLFMKKDPLISPTIEDNKSGDTLLLPKKDEKVKKKWFSKREYQIEIMDNDFFEKDFKCPKCSKKMKKTKVRQDNVLLFQELRCKKCLLKRRYEFKIQ